MSAQAETVPGRLARLAAERPGDVAVRSKRRGIWEVTTWAQLRDRVRAVALGLRAAGVRPGDAVALVAENSPGWVVTDLAIQWLGARSVAMPPQSPPQVVARALADADARVVVCGDQEQVDAVTASRDTLPDVRTVVAIDTTGIDLAAVDGARSLADLERDGERLAHEDATALATAEAASSGGVAVFSAGSAGAPRRVDHDAAAIAEQAGTAATWLALVPGDRNLVTMSLALPAGRLLDLYAPLVAGAQIGLTESPATVLVDLREAMPTVLTTTPRGLELLRWASDGRAHQASSRRRAVYRWAMRRLDRGLDATASSLDRAGRWSLPYALVGRRVVSQIGLRRTRRIAVAGGPTGAAEQRFFWGLGVPAVEIYGTAEVVGVALAQRGLADVGTVGAPLPGIDAEVRDGTLALRGPVTGGRWIDTGDVATLDADGRYTVRGRRDDRLAGAGEDVHAAEVERALTAGRYVRRAAVVAVDGGVRALVEVDFDTTAAWAASHDIAFSTYGSLIGVPEVQQLLASEVETVNAALAGRTTIVGLALLPRPLDVAAGELTPVLSVRREVVIERFAGDAVLRIATGPAA